jgi:hypothetical protein
MSNAEACKFVPTVLEPDELERTGLGFLTVIIEARKCAACHRLMVGPFRDQTCDEVSSIFGSAILGGGASLRGQLNRAGAVMQSNIGTVDEAPICVECAAQGKATFQCAKCNQVKLSSNLYETFGSLYPDHACNQCYEITPAKEWDEFIMKLAEDHRWDND